MHQPLERVDVILALGSHDLRVAEYAARLFLDGWAPLLLCSGGRGSLTSHWDEPEAVKFARVAQVMGVPARKILREEHSTNTGENATFSKALLHEHGIEVDACILVHKPYMERRAFATFRKIWPEVRPVMSSPPIAFIDYPTAEIGMEDVINIMVGDFQRILVYPKLGFQVVQPVPDEVMQAYLHLVDMGFTSRLVDENPN